MQPQEILELMGSAPARYESVRAALTYRGDGPTIKAVRERYWWKFAGSAEPWEPIRHPEPDGPFGWCCRIWRVDNHRWRQELELPGGGVQITVSTGRVRTRGTPEGLPGTSEMWERRIGGAAHTDDPGWSVETSTPWRSRRSTSTSAFPKPSPRANLWPGDVDGLASRESPGPSDNQSLRKLPGSQPWRRRKGAICRGLRLLL